VTTRHRAPWQHGAGWLAVSFLSTRNESMTKRRKPIYSATVANSPFSDPKHPLRHRGLAYYDRERRRKPLSPIVGELRPASPEIVAWLIRQEVIRQNPPTPVESLDDPPIAQNEDYTLERCHVETVCHRREWRGNERITICQPVAYHWELTFAGGATFRFVSRAIAEAALSELLRIHKTKHPRPKYGKHSPDNDCVFFGDRKLRKLPDDTLPAELPTCINPIETAA
jgi:hypothetical protein